MEFTLQCECGASLRVVGTDAACTRRCRYGSEFQIPRLTELRRLEDAGITTLSPQRVGDAPSQLAPPTKHDYLTVAQKLQLQSINRRLPFETRCLECELTTDHALICYIECELPEVKRSGRFWDYFATIGLAFIVPIDGLAHVLMHWPEEEDVEVVSNEVVVRAPLRLCPECAARLRRNKQVVREMLQRMPLYQPLFRQYPDAGINIPNL